MLEYPWEILLYHTNRYMQRGSLMENYAILKLQEQIITQVKHVPSFHAILQKYKALLKALKNFI